MKPLTRHHWAIATLVALAWANAAWIILGRN